MTFNTSSWCVREEVNQAKLRFEIPNFSKVVANTTKGHRISSNQFDVGGSRFVLDIYPNGQWQAKRGMFSASLQNENTMMLWWTAPSLLRGATHCLRKM